MDYLPSDGCATSTTATTTTTTTRRRRAKQRWKEKFSCPTKQRHGAERRIHRLLVLFLSIVDEKCH